MGPPKHSLSSASAAVNSYLANKNKKTTAITAAKGNKRLAHTPTIVSSVLWYCDIIFICWAFNIMFFVRRKIHELKIPTKYSFT